MSKFSQVEKRCEHCGNNYSVQKYRTESARFCSQACKKESQKDEMVTSTCKHCSRKFDRSKFKLKGKNSFCSKKCADAYNKGSNHYEYKEHLHDKHFKLALKQWSLKVKEKDSYTCQLCGDIDRKVLEAHHIKEKGKFPELVFDFNNGITLCLRCHALQHTNDPKSLRLIQYKIKKYYNEDKK